MFVHKANFMQNKFLERYVFLPQLPCNKDGCVNKREIQQIFVKNQINLKLCECTEQYRNQFSMMI